MRTSGGSGSVALAEHLVHQTYLVREARVELGRLQRNALSHGKSMGWGKSGLAGSARVSPMSVLGRVPIVV